MITPSQIPNPYVKPKWQASVGTMTSVVAYNCRKHGFPLPVFAMPLWEGAGNRVMDYSGHGNHGVNTGVDWVANGAYFNGGVSSYTTCADSDSLDLTTEGTISFWTYPYQTGGAHTIITKGNGLDAATLRYWIGYDYDSPAKIRMGVSNGSSAQSLVANSDLSVNELHHVVGKWDSSYIYLYVDGVCETPLAQTSIPTVSAFPLLFGTLNIGTPYSYKGVVLGVEIFNHALSASQVKFLYDNPYFMYRMPEELYGYAAAVGGDTVTYTSDALFKKLGLTTAYTSDALLKKQAIPVTYSADALLKIQNLLKTYTSDILIKLTDGDVTYSADVLLELDGITKAYSSDLLIAVRNTKAYTTDALLKALGISTTYTADALLKLIDESKTYTADSLIKKVDAGIPYTADALLKKEDVSATYTADLLIQHIDNVLSYTADLIIKLVATRTYTADALLKKLNNVASYTADVIINVAGVSSVTYTADALFKLNNITKAYTADLLIMVTNTLSYTADALIKKTDASVNYSSDALFKSLGLTTTYTADALLQKTNLTVGYSSDALLQKAFTAAYTSDALLKKEGATLAYTADALLKKAVSLSYSADVIISTFGGVSYTADLLIDIVSAEYPAKVFFIRKSGTPQTGLTPTIDCYNKVADGSSGGGAPMVRELGCGYYKFHYNITEDIVVTIDTGDITMTGEERYLNTVLEITKYDATYTLLKQHDAKITGLLM